MQKWPEKYISARLNAFFGFTCKKRCIHKNMNCANVYFRKSDVREEGAISLFICILAFYYQTKGVSKYVGKRL
jgi:hypothetical protein